MIFVLLLFIILSVLILYKKLYFAPVAAVRISSVCVDIVSLKPNKKLFRQISGSYSSSFVKIAPGILAFIVDRSDLEPCLMYKDIVIRSDVYLFLTSKGRFKSIDLTDRLLVESISKFSQYSV